MSGCVDVPIPHTAFHPAPISRFGPWNASKMARCRTRPYSSARVSYCLTHATSVSSQGPCARLELLAQDPSGWAHVTQALRAVQGDGADARKVDAIRFCFEYGHGAPHVVAAVACSRLAFEAAP
jgi:hypothetical protein